MEINLLVNIFFYFMRNSETFFLFCKHVLDGIEWKKKLKMTIVRNVCINKNTQIQYIYIYIFLFLSSKHKINIEV